MQINEGKFLQNGRCGYVLKPATFMQNDFDPNHELNSPQIDEEPFILNVKVAGDVPFGTLNNTSKHKIK